MPCIQLEGYSMQVDWAPMRYGDSFFVPSVAWKADKELLMASATEARLVVDRKSVV